MLVILKGLHDFVPVLSTRLHAHAKRNNVWHPQFSRQCRGQLHRTHLCTVHVQAAEESPSLPLNQTILVWPSVQSKAIQSLFRAVTLLSRRRSPSCTRLIHFAKVLLRATWNDPPGKRKGCEKADWQRRRVEYAKHDSRAGTVN